MIIDSILKINKWQPDCNYYLDVSDFLINNSNEATKEKSFRKLPKRIEKIEGYLSLALSFFEEEKNSLNENQIKWFVLKKNLIKNRLELLKTLSLKNNGKLNN